jgi:hypothetical protein
LQQEEGLLWGIKTATMDIGDRVLELLAGRGEFDHADENGSMLRASQKEYLIKN